MVLSIRLLSVAIPESLLPASKLFKKLYYTRAESGGAHQLEPRSIGRSAEADVALAQEDPRAAAVLTVVYPLWWATMPAMMKGYIERVFARGRFGSCAHLRSAPLWALTPHASIDDNANFKLVSYALRTK
jgi:hypothetical protein